MVWLGAVLGLRWSEVAGLRVGRIDTACSCRDPQIPSTNYRCGIRWIVEVAHRCERLREHWQRPITQIKHLDFKPSVGLGPLDDPRCAEVGGAPRAGTPKDDLPFRHRLLLGLVRAPAGPVTTSMLSGFARRRILEIPSSIRLSASKGTRHRIIWVSTPRVSSRLNRGESWAVRLAAGDRLGS
jgi:hypothetical protein